MKKKPKIVEAEEKYVRILMGAPVEDYKRIGVKVLDGKLKWSYYGCDGDKGYQYYLVL